VSAQIQVLSESPGCRWSGFGRGETKSLRRVGAFTRRSVAICDNRELLCRSTIEIAMTMRRGALPVPFQNWRTPNRAPASLLDFIEKLLGFRPAHFEGDQLRG